MSAQEIDQYLDALEESKRATLARLRQTILEILPEADQGISYGVPAFKVRGKAIAGHALITAPAGDAGPARRLALPAEQAAARQRFHPCDAADADADASPDREPPKAA